MKPHRVKHIPTGLYYKPFGGTSNLSSVGKVYITKGDPLSVNKEEEYIYISIRKDSSILKKFPNEFPELEPSNYNYNYVGKIPKSKFEIEYLE